MKSIGWHIAPHTYATQLLESTADIYTVKELLGHTKIETTMKYAKVTDRKRRKAMDSLPKYGFKKDKKRDKLNWEAYQCS